MAYQLDNRSASLALDGFGDFAPRIAFGPCDAHLDEPVAGQGPIDLTLNGLRKTAGTDQDDRSQRMGL